MHIYQKHIIDELRQVDSARYSELQPDHIESSHFKYHLNQLIKDAYVEQEKKGVYRLTDAGIAFTDKLSVQGVNPKQTPKVITYTLLYQGDDYYLHRKDKEPYRNLLNMVGGKMHLHESAQEAARREVLEKTTLTVEPELRGVANIRIHKGDTLLSHVTAYVFVAELNASLANDSLEKVPAKELHDATGLAPDLPALLTVLKDSKGFFIEDLASTL